MTTWLTEHFSLEEMVFSQTASREGIDNTPSAEIELALQQLCFVLEKVRVLLGDQPILISSGYRCPALNTAIGGSSTSAHMSGLAADFTCPAFGSPYDVCKQLENEMVMLGIDQLIWEYGDWVHLGLAAPPAPPRCQCLTIDSSGTTSGFA